VALLLFTNTLKITNNRGSWQHCNNNNKNFSGKRGTELTGNLLITILTPVRFTTNRFICLVLFFNVGF